jgi:peptidoglycan/LPS O-acetylase OafA/YrhL
VQGGNVPAQTIGQRIEETGGRPSGFDYMRLILAVLVVCWHSAITAYGVAVQTEFGSGPARPIIVTALVIGPLLTTLPSRDYFVSHDFLKYFSNALGHPHFTLAGVFESNPSHKVNGQMWTVPFELECYVILCVLSRDTRS